MSDVVSLGDFPASKWLVITLVSKSTGCILTNYHEMLARDSSSTVLMARHGSQRDVVNANGTRCRLSDPVPRETVNRWSDDDDDDGALRSELRTKRVAAKRLLWGCDRETTREGRYENSPVEGMVGRGEREDYWLGEGAPKERNSPGRGMTMWRRVAYSGEGA